LHDLTEPASTATEFAYVEAEVFAILLLQPSQLDAQPNELGTVRLATFFQPIGENQTGQVGLWLGDDGAEESEIVGVGGDAGHDSP